MENYNRIIGALMVRFQRALPMQIKTSFGIENYYETDNTFLYVKKGCIYFGKDRQPVHAGEVLFIPAGKGLSLNFSDPNPKHIFGNDYYEQSKECILEPNVSSRPDLDVVLCVQLEAKVFDAVNLFVSLDVFPFVIKDNKKILGVLSDIHEEETVQYVGKTTLLECKCKELVTLLLRHLIQEKLFVQQISTNSTNLNDERLITLFQHINENLSTDLSNKRLAIVADISEDYVGQYFKTLTGINPQDYIEFQRMQRATALLRNSGKSIRDIGHAVGYKDSSYFCRRFKMMFGISPGRMRRRESVRATVV